MSSPSHVNRRDFTRAALAGTAAGLAPAVARARGVIGANDRVRLGCIGVGYRGVQVLNAFLTQKDAQIVALCDVYEPYLDGQFDRIHPHFKKLGRTCAVAAAGLRRTRRAAQGLPPGPR